MKRFAIALTAALTGLAWAQSPAVEPPADALAPDAPRLRVAVAGQLFHWRTGDSGRADPGVSGRMEFREGGVVTIETSTGTFDTGAWSIDAARLCFQWKTSGSGCNDVRIAGNTLWLRHTNGKWSTMTLLRKPGAGAGSG